MYEKDVEPFEGKEGIGRIESYYSKEFLRYGLKRSIVTVSVLRYRYMVNLF